MATTHQNVLDSIRSRYLNDVPADAADRHWPDSELQISYDGARAFLFLHRPDAFNVGSIPTTEPAEVTNYSAAIDYRWQYRLAVEHLTAAECYLKSTDDEAMMASAQWHDGLAIRHIKGVR